MSVLGYVSLGFGGSGCDAGDTSDVFQAGLLLRGLVEGTVRRG